VAQVRITLANATRSATVRVATHDATAVSGRDYIGIQESLKLTPRNPVFALNISVMTMAFGDNWKSFTVDLSSPSSATLGNAQARVVIGSLECTVYGNWEARFRFADAPGASLYQVQVNRYGTNALLLAADIPAAQAALVDGHREIVSYADMPLYGFVGSVQISSPSGVTTLSTLCLEVPYTTIN